MSDLLNTAQAAHYLSLRPATLEHWRMTRNGPPFVRVGPRIVRYRRTDLDVWIESCVETRNS